MCTSASSNSCAAQLQCSAQAVSKDHLHLQEQLDAIQRSCGGAGDRACAAPGNNEQERPAGARQRVENSPPPLAPARARIRARAHLAPSDGRPSAMAGPGGRGASQGEPPAARRRQRSSRAGGRAGRGAGGGPGLQRRRGGHRAGSVTMAARPQCQWRQGEKAGGVANRAPHLLTVWLGNPGDGASETLKPLQQPPDRCGRTNHSVHRRDMSVLFALFYN